MNEAQLPRKSLLKVVVLGDAGVGKTSLCKQYVNETFDKQYKPTIGADFLTKDLGALQLQIWDTAGMERFRSMAVSFYRGADACILVYDICDVKTFENLEMWMKEFLNNVGVDISKEDFPFVVLGNKVDMSEEKKVSRTRAEAWCKSKKNVSLFETSALSKQNLNEAFDEIAEVAGRCMQPISVKDVQRLNQPEIQGLDDSKAVEDEPDADDESGTPSELEQAPQVVDELHVRESPDESLLRGPKKPLRQMSAQGSANNSSNGSARYSHRENQSTYKNSRDSQKEHRRNRKNKSVRNTRRNSASSSTSRDHEDNRSLPSNDPPQGGLHSRRSTPYRHGRMNSIRLDEDDRYSTGSESPIGCCEF